MESEGFAPRWVSGSRQDLWRVPDTVFSRYLIPKVSDTVLLFLILSLALPNPAFAMRAQGVDDPKGSARVGLEEALNEDRPVQVAQVVVTPTPLATSNQPPVSVLKRTGLEEDPVALDRQIEDLKAQRQRALDYRESVKEIRVFGQHMDFPHLLQIGAALSEINWELWKALRQKQRISGTLSISREDAEWMVAFWQGYYERLSKQLNQVRLELVGLRPRSNVDWINLDSRDVDELNRLERKEQDLQQKINQWAQQKPTAGLEEKAARDRVQSGIRDLVDAQRLRGVQALDEFEQRVVVIGKSIYENEKFSFLPALVEKALGAVSGKVFFDTGEEKGRRRWFSKLSQEIPGGIPIAAFLGNPDEFKSFNAFANEAGMPVYRPKETAQGPLDFVLQVLKSSGLDFSYLSQEQEKQLHRDIALLIRA